jgi:hypothetical protein
MEPITSQDNDRIFSRIVNVDIPSSVAIDSSTGRSVMFSIKFSTDGVVPFPQLIIRDYSKEHIFKEQQISTESDNVFIAHIPSGLLTTGTFNVQVEGCRLKEWQNAGGGDWIKWNGQIKIDSLQPANRNDTKKIRVKRDPSGVKVYFGIHKHMHQPFYRATDPLYWDGEKDGIFESRSGPYTTFIPNAVNQYISGNLPHAGLSTSWSGSLIEQLERCKKDGLCSGRFGSWNNALEEIAGKFTSLGNPRVAFSSFGYFHPIMPLIPQRNIVKQIQMHRDVVKTVFGTETTDIIFPPETAFHVRIIPALKEAGVNVVIYDSIHRYHSCKDYPYAGMNEGMLPPNPAEQENPSVNDWVQLQNIWAGSKISPSLLKPEYIKYEDVDGKVYKIIGVPAERYIGNEDARGGFGALQYEHVLGQVYNNIVENNTFDPAHPPFFILHSDGDNYGGGADSYYNHNTEKMIEWLNQDDRFELITINDYLRMFPPNESKAIHIEPGSWSGADNGDPQFRKWFSMYDQPYSPDLNSWAVLTALQNCIHSLEDAGITGEPFRLAQRLMLTAETSCYWYWTGQEIWDRQVTEAANAALSLVKNDIESIRYKGDVCAPTIFSPWVTPENPGGKTWGQGCLRDAEKTATVHTFIYDITGITKVSLFLRTGNKEQRFDMRDMGTYPTRTNPQITSNYYTLQLPQALGNVKFYIEAADNCGNRSVSSLERIYLA